MSTSCSVQPPSWPRWFAPASFPRASSSRRRCVGSTSSSRRSTRSRTSPTSWRWTRPSDRAERSAAVCGRADRDQGQPARSPDMPLTMGSDLFGDFTPSTTRPCAPAPRRRVRDRRQDLDAGDGDPPDNRASSVRPDRATRGTWTARPADRVAVGGGGGRRHGPGRARQRRRRLDPNPRLVLRPGRAEAGARTGLVGARQRAQLPRLRRRADALGRRHRERARRTRRPRARGRDLGAAPAGGRLRRAAEPDPGRLRIGLALIPPLEDATLDPVCEQAARDAAALLESLGHEVEEVTPPWSTSTCSRTSPACSGRLSRSRRGGRSLAGREPTADDVEPLTWALWERARSRTRSPTWRADPDRVGRALVRRVPRRLRRGVDAGARRARPFRPGRSTGAGRTPWATIASPGCFTPFTAIVNVTGQPAIALPLYHGEDGLPTAVQLIGPPAREEVLLPRDPAREALPWAERAPALARR